MNQQFVNLVPATQYVMVELILVSLLAFGENQIEVMLFWIVFSFLNFACFFTSISLSLITKHFRGGSDNQCELGHAGPICGDCDEGYSKFGITCVECMDRSVNLMRIVIALTLYLLFLTFYVL